MSLTYAYIDPVCSFRTEVMRLKVVELLCLEGMLFVFGKKSSSTDHLASF